MHGPGWNDDDDEYDYVNTQRFHDPPDLDDMPENASIDFLLEERYRVSLKAPIRALAPGQIMTLYEEKREVANALEVLGGCHMIVTL